MQADWMTLFLKKAEFFLIKKNKIVYAIQNSSVKKKRFIVTISHCFKDFLFQYSLVNKKTKKKENHLE